MGAPTGPDAQAPSHGSKSAGNTVTPKTDGNPSDWQPLLNCLRSTETDHQADGRFMLREALLYCVIYSTAAVLFDLGGISKVDQKIKN